MPSDRSLLQREMADVDIRPLTIDEFHRRRHRQQRRRRAAGAMAGVALAVLVVVGAVGTVLPDGGDEVFTTDVPGPNLVPSPFAGSWVSVDTDGSHQTMEIQPVGAAGEHRVEMRDEMATKACANAGPATLTGTGRLQTDGTLVVAMELRCDDGSTPIPMLDPVSEAELLAELSQMVVEHLPESDELVFSEVTWRRADAGGDPALAASSPFEGSWVVGRAGAYFPDTLAIRVVDGADLHEVVMRKAETPQCAGGASTMRGTGRREANRTEHPGAVQLAVVVDLTCDDGETPTPQAPEEEGMLENLGISFLHDPVTDELLGSLGSVFIREGTELAGSDPMAAIDAMVEAVGTGDSEAFLDLFAPDGAIRPRGYFVSAAVLDPQPTAQAGRVEAWMAANDAWGFDAEVISCAEDPDRPASSGAATDAWIACDVASRWQKLSLEIVERWSFEVRGERLVRWEPNPQDLDPLERQMALGFTGLQDWETWLAERRPDDAARWLNPSADAATEAVAPDLRPEERLTWTDSEARATWVFDGLAFRPTRLVPYDPAFADDIEASIDQYRNE